MMCGIFFVKVDIVFDLRVLCTPSNRWLEISGEDYCRMEGWIDG